MKPMIKYGGGKMDHIEVKMFDGSLWKGKFKSESTQCVTLRKCK